MSSLSSPIDRPTVKEIVLLALMGAMMMGAKVAMAALPNIEPVSLFILCGTLVFGWKYMYSIVIYIMLEGFTYGFGIWWFNYLYIWPLLAVGVMLLRNSRSYILLTILSALFGLLFGALCAIPFFFMGGWAAGISYWISGIPFDLFHFVGNGAMAALLLKPLHTLLSRLAGTTLWSEK